MECVNCQKQGHIFRDCKEPVHSYGIVAIRMMKPVGDSDGGKLIPHYLLIQRRDSLSYVDFLRGKYCLSDRKYIETLLSQMTSDELDRMLTQSFDELWVRLWNSQNTRQYRYEYDSAKKTFEKFLATGDISGKLLSEYISEIKSSSSVWITPEWGFPKGRRTPHESDLACAIREFCEETGLHSKDIFVYKKETPELEEYTGSNNIQYRHIYFLAGCDEDVSVNISNRIQTREVGDIKWLPFEEAYLKIRSTNPEKRGVLGRIHARIMKLNKIE